MTSATPGPWEVTTFRAVNGDMCPGVKSSKTSAAVAWLAHGDDGSARLIAAAPSLLEALMLAELRLTHLAVGGVPVLPDLKAARAAIAKAGVA